MSYQPSCASNKIRDDYQIFFLFKEILVFPSNEQTVNFYANIKIFKDM